MKWWNDVRCILQLIWTHDTHRWCYILFRCPRKLTLFFTSLGAITTNVADVSSTAFRLSVKGSKWLELRIMWLNKFVPVIGQLEHQYKVNLNTFSNNVFINIIVFTIGIILRPTELYLKSYKIDFPLDKHNYERL